MDPLFNFISSTVSGVEIYSKIYQNNILNKLHQQFSSEGAENYSIQLIRNIYFKLTEEYFQTNIKNCVEYRNIFNSKKFDKVEACKICLGKIFNKSVDHLLEKYDISIELDKNAVITIIMDYVGNINCLSKIKTVQDLYVITICHLALLTHNYIQTNIIGDFMSGVKDLTFDDHVNSLIGGAGELNDLHDYKSQYSSEELIKLYNNNTIDDSFDSDDGDDGKNRKRKRKDDVSDKDENKTKSRRINKSNKKTYQKKNPRNPRK